MLLKNDVDDKLLGLTHQSQKKKKNISKGFVTASQIPNACGLK